MAGKQPDTTRSRILEDAFGETHRHGFQAASLNNILAKTGLTKGALYHHSPDKDRLGHALIVEAARWMRRPHYCWSHIPNDDRLCIRIRKFEQLRIAKTTLS